MFGKQGDKLRFFVGAEGKAQRVLPVRHQPAGFYRVVVQRLRQRVKIDPLAHVGCH